MKLVRDICSTEILLRINRILSLETTLFLEETWRKKHSKRSSDWFTGCHYTISAREEWSRGYIIVQTSPCGFRRPNEPEPPTRTSSRPDPRLFLDRNESRISRIGMEPWNRVIVSSRRASSGFFKPRLHWTTFWTWWNIELNDCFPKTTNSLWWELFFIFIFRCDFVVHFVYFWGDKYFE